MLLAGLLLFEDSLVLSGKYILGISRPRKSSALVDEKWDLRKVDENEFVGSLLQNNFCSCDLYFLFFGILLDHQSNLKFTNQ